VYFHVVVVQGRQGNLQKSVLHVQTYCKPIVSAVLVAVSGVRVNQFKKENDWGLGRALLLGSE